MTIKISGHLSSFGALAIALLVLAFSFQQLGSFELSSTAQTYAGIVFAVIIFGAILAIVSRYVRIPKIM